MSKRTGKMGVILINFGEPDEPTPERVIPFLERIFLQNAGLEPDESAVERARQLARDRAPGLIKEYRKIGGSPLNRQADRQAKMLEEALGARDVDATVYSAFQFTRPFIPEVIERAKTDAIETLIVLPGYPICGRSTTVAALEAVHAAMGDLKWAPRFAAVSGWHHHPEYEALRASNIATFVRDRGLDLREPDTLLHFSVHGTPLQYLDEGSRYDRYVEEHCRAIAHRLGADRCGVGFQNHTNRRIAWTQPDNEVAIRARPERRLVVVPIAFMHEQSETLAELDGELRELVESLGKEFHRVPIPHEAPEFGTFLADLVELLVAGCDSETAPRMARCRCTTVEGVMCANALRELPPSPYAKASLGS